MEAAIELVVRSTEIDVNGHVNNAKYLEYLEWSREEWYDQNGLHYDTLLELGVQTVTVNININYRQECRQGEKLIITTRPERAGNTSFVMRQEIRKENGDLAADAAVTTVCMDSETRKSRPLPDEMRRKLTV